MFLFHANEDSIGSDAVSRWAGLALAHLEFGVPINPIPTRGAEYANHITACPPGFENLATSLIGVAKWDVTNVGSNEQN